MKSRSFVSYVDILIFLKEKQINKEKERKKERKMFFFFPESDGAQGAGDDTATMATEAAPTAPAEPNVLEQQFYKVKEELITGSRLT